MKSLQFVTSAVILILTSCVVAIAQDVNTDHDKNVNFSQYRTFYWEKVHTSNPLWQQRITDAVDKQLASKGWQETQAGADVAVTAVGATQTEQEFQTFYTGLGPRWRWGGFDNATTTVNRYRVGTLVLDMYDAKTRQLIWRGTATDTLSDKPEKNEDKLAKAVQKMFAKFPPPQGK